MASANVTCGANDLSLEKFVGLSLASIKSKYGEMLNIPADCEVRVNGETKESLEYIVQEDDEVEFVKKSGSKG